MSPYLSLLFHLLVFVPLPSPLSSADADIDSRWVTTNRGIFGEACHWQQPGDTTGGRFLAPSQRGDSDGRALYGFNLASVGLYNTSQNGILQGAEWHADFRLYVIDVFEEAPGTSTVHALERPFVERSVSTHLFGLFL